MLKLNLNANNSIKFWEPAFSLVTKGNTFSVRGRGYETRMGVIMDNYEI
jgi:hypothetical protein